MWNKNALLGTWRPWKKSMSRVPEKLRKRLEENERRRATVNPPSLQMPKHNVAARQPTWQTSSGWSQSLVPKPLQISRQPKYAGVQKKKRVNRSTVTAQRPACEVVQLDKESVRETVNSELLQGLIDGLNANATEPIGLIREYNGINGRPNYLYSHQREAVEIFVQRLRKMRWIVNGADMGLGKTLMTILLYSIYCVRETKHISQLPSPIRPVDRTGGWKLLVVGTKSLPTGWFDELSKWTWFESSNILLEESADKLEKSMSHNLTTTSEVAVVLTTYDIVRLTYLKTHRQITHPNDERRKIWVPKEGTQRPALFEWVKMHGEKLIVAFDESHHRLRNQDSQTAVAHTALMQYAPKSKGILTSGTACCNRPSDLMSQMRAIGDRSEYIDPDAWYPDKRDHKVVSTDAINYWREHMICIPGSVLRLPKLHQVLIEADVNTDSLIPWDAYQTLVDEARSACTFNSGETEAQRNEKSVKLIAALRKLDLMLIHPNLVRYDAKTLRVKENSHLLDEMVRKPTVYLSAVIDIVLDTFRRGERSMIITSESVTVMTLLRHAVDIGLARHNLQTKNYIYTGTLDMMARFQMQSAFGIAANAPPEDNPTTMHICWLSMRAGANGITLLGPRTMLKIPPGNFDPTLPRQVDKRFHRIGVEGEVRVLTLRVHGSAAHAIASVNDDKKYLSELTTNLNTLGDGDGESFGCTPLDSKISESISWKVKGTYAQNLWDYNPTLRKLVPPTPKTVPLD